MKNCCWNPVQGLQLLELVIAYNTYNDTMIHYVKYSPHALRVQQSHRVITSHWSQLVKLARTERPKRVPTAPSY